MDMPARDALPVVYGLCDEWMARRQLLAAMGVEDLDALDNALQPGRVARLVGGEQWLAER